MKGIALFTLGIFLMAGIFKLFPEIPVGGVIGVAVFFGVVEGVFVIILAKTGISKWGR